ncbi:hypothetical protein WMY93_031832 [Mugilogobius chulae]|uniref:Sodium/calcium exchanger membrane region domain-containing protein n=1 Tax=Mugilogobius chulae TaxID=88201 RepID=A0AAW0MCV8_9GOBI
MENAVQWVESSLLILGYVAYVMYTEYSAKIETMVKREDHFRRNTIHVQSAEQLVKDDLFVALSVMTILFVIGMCAIFAQDNLSLTWWPLCRDVSFYFMYLMTLIFLMDNAVQWFESSLLILGYVAYVMYIEYSAKIEKMLKELPLRRNTIHVQSAEQLVKVRTLTVIIKKLQISEDVAGATFMAAGRSAPELFTSLIGAFIAHSNIRIGTIVGSAVFNILFVIGMCAIFAQDNLSLTWWPLCRDVSFYFMYLMTLISFLMENAVQWVESSLLILGVVFMKYNAKIETMVKREDHFRRNTIHVQSAEQLVKDDLFVALSVMTILFLIGMCAIFAQEVLSLTWWPLCRDVSFYLMYLMTLISFLMDNAVQWFESSLLILGYVAYVMYIEYSAKIEKMLKELPLRRNTIHVQSAEQLVKDDLFVAFSVMTILSRRSKSSSKSSRFQRTLPGRPSWRLADLLLNFLHP